MSTLAEAAAASCETASLYAGIDAAAAAAAATAQPYYALSMPGTTTETTPYRKRTSAPCSATELETSVSTSNAQLSHAYNQRAAQIGVPGRDPLRLAVIAAVANPSFLSESGHLLPQAPEFITYYQSVDQATMEFCRTAFCTEMLPAIRASLMSGLVLFTHDAEDAVADGVVKFPNEPRSLGFLPLEVFVQQFNTEAEQVRKIVEAIQTHAGFMQGAVVASVHHHCTIFYQLNFAAI